MSDQTPPPPPQQTPRPRPQQQQARRRPVPQPRSTESRFVGYLVLGFGLIAVIAVLMLAFMGGKQSTPQVDAAQPSAAEQAKDIATTMQGRFEPPPYVAPKPKVDLHFKRQPNFKAAQMEGNWQGTIGIYTAVLQINKGVYQVILASGQPGMPRFYSSGEYKVLEDMISFRPRNDWPTPATKNQNITYQRITRGSFAMIAAFQDGKMLWQNVPPDESRVLAPVTTPLFMSEPVDYVVWQKMD